MASALSLQFSPYVLPFAASCLFLGALIGYTYRQSRARGFTKTNLWLLVLLLTALVWAGARAAQLSTGSVALKQFWIVVLYVGYGGSPVAMLCFALSYTGRKHLVTRRNVLLLSLVPAVALVLAATNWYHELLWTLDVQRDGGPVYIDRDFSASFLAPVVYNNLLNLAAIYLLVKMALGSRTLYRRQAIAVSVGVLVPMIAGQLYVLDAYPFLARNVDLTPVGMTVTGVCFTYAIFRVKLLDLVPVARDTVVESMRDGYVVLDTRNRVVDLNPAAEEIVDDEAPVGKSVATVVPEASDAVAAHEHGTQHEDEIEVERDGEQRFLVIGVSSLHDDGELIGRLCILRDVTERRSVQKRYQALIENASDLIYVLDDDGTIEYASPSVATVTGAPTGSVVGRDAFEFIHPDDRDRMRTAFERLVDDPTSRSRFEYRVRDVDGIWRTMEGVARNLLANPFVEGIVVNARDITERKERERELERANERLERFASVISHDLRNPLNVANGHLQIARETGDSAALEEIETSHDRMEAIIEDVLALARQGRSIGETERIDLDDIAETAWGHVATDEATLRVETERPVEADPDRLAQLFENLFRNAHEHVGPDVAVTVDETEDGFLVADDGPGVPEGERDRVLESGYTTNEDGTGFGLAIVSQIADAHGWAVRVDESADGGAAFVFEGVGRRAGVRRD